MSKWYETTDDRVREKAFVKKIEERCAAKLERIGGREYGNYWVRDEKGCIAIADVRTRTCSVSKFGTLIVNQDRFERVNALADKQSVPYLIFCRWKDFDGFYRTKREDLMSSLGGRFDRNDEKDYCPVYKISIKKFERV